MRAAVREIVIDCNDAATLARFWGELVNARFAKRHEDWWVVAATPLLLAFQQVPEPKSSTKNRLHLDIQVDDAHAAIAAAERLGARQRAEPTLDADGDGYVVMADPEDNEFCFVVDNGGA